MVEKTLQEIKKTTDIKVVSIDMFSVNSENELKELTESFMIEPSKCGGIREGVVIRVSDSFNDEKFSTHVAKMVRANHIQTSTHWREQEIIRNKLI